ncbi:hypothetical protein T01_14195 [Trichinella spiralis]|uniref:Uncharacterized protein n=1 Tax=Trichinella spiralis TaxID=6334 RepID=A0A0V1BF19_TRISP|nr:hypothetical protein T01_14195 [Trichinella spiralis]
MFDPVRPDFLTLVKKRITKRKVQSGSVVIKEDEAEKTAPAAAAAANAIVVAIATTSASSGDVAQLEFDDNICSAED